MDQSQGAVSPGDEKRSGISWLKLLRWSAITSVIVVALINVFAGIIPPLIIFAVLWIAGVVWLARSTRGPAILLLVAFVGFMGLSAPFVIPTLAVPASAGDFILNLASLLAALAGIVAAIFVIRGNVQRSGTARTIAVAGVALFVVASIGSVIATLTYDDAVLREGDIELVAKDIRFTSTTLEAEAGRVSVFLDNQDATLHTFTVDGLDVDLDVPAAKSASVTFEVEPGEYTFYCVPHEGDMKGTLVVE